MIAALEQLTGREARCLCKRVRPSVDLIDDGFFRYRGEGSRDATEICGVITDMRNGRPHEPHVCRYSKVAHGEINASTRRPGINDHEFTPQGAQEFDSWYCGCRGWD